MNDVFCRCTSNKAGLRTHELLHLIRLPMHNTVAINKQFESNSSSTVAGAVPGFDWLPVSPVLPHQADSMGKN